MGDDGGGRRVRRGGWEEHSDGLSTSMQLLSKKRSKYLVQQLCVIVKIGP